VTTVDRRAFIRTTAIASAATAGLATAGLATEALAAGRPPGTPPPTYLTDIRAPVADEIDVTRLTVDGVIPRELRGRYVRNGPNPKPGVTPYDWWAGQGMLHGIRLRDGHAEWYRNRWVDVRTGPVTLPSGQHNWQVGPANTSVRYHAGKLYALVEVALPYEVTDELCTVGPVDFGGRLNGAMTAHPKLSPLTGELHFFGYSPYGPPFVTYHRLSRSGALVRSVPIDLPEPILMHDFAITANHIIWPDLPMVWDRNGHPVDFPVWSDTHAPRIGVMPTDGDSSDIRWFPVSPRWSWHMANAHEDARGRVVVEAITGDGPTWTDMARYFGGVSGARVAGNLYRWTLDMSTGRVSEEPLDDLATEFPTINDDRVGLDHRYVYSATSPLYPVRHNRVVKHDTRDGTQRSHYLGPDVVAGEAVFVPADGACREDDGWLLTLTHDLRRKASSLLILDASAPERRPVATVHLPRRVPYGFHGLWVPDGVLASV
jgi:carotenoid cleavage dioxygenase-like enzyme